jgi:hypothetical protein
MKLCCKCTVKNQLKMLLMRQKNKLRIIYRRFKKKEKGFKETYTCNRYSQNLILISKITHAKSK